MAAPMLPRAARDRLTKLAGMLGSDHEGERASAALLATRLLREHGLTWADALNPLPATSSAPWSHRWTPARPTEVRALAAWCTRYAEFLSEWEMDFAANVARRDRPATPKQTDIVRRIADRVARCTAGERAA